LIMGWKRDYLDIIILENLLKGLPGPARMGE
jgi:hypothetical protein